MQTSLANALRIVAGVLLVVATIAVLVYDNFSAPPYVLAGVLGLLSFAADRWQRPTAFGALVLAVLVPVGAILGYLGGSVPVFVPIFDVALFGWLGWCALSVVRPAPAGA
jgi:hypothetical protein